MSMSDPPHPAKASPLGNSEQINFDTVFAHDAGLRTDPCGKT